MRPSPSLRATLVAAALSLAIALAAAPVPAVAASGTRGTSTPNAAIARVGVGVRHLELRAGRLAVLRGSVLPRRPGYRALLQVRRPAGWRTLDRDRTGVHGRYRLHRRLRVPMDARARLVLRGGGRRIARPVGRLRVYRVAVASWYGPGLYGNHLACGGRLGYGTLGVAHKWLPCGTPVSFRRDGRVVTVRVIDRGPYVWGREYDLTAATARRLGFRGHGAILTTR